MADRSKLVPRPLLYPIHEVTMSSQRILGWFKIVFRFVKFRFVWEQTESENFITQ